MIWITIIVMAFSGSVSAQVYCTNEYLDCADIAESETDTVRLVSMYGAPGDTVWLDIHFTVPNDTMSGFVTLIRYDHTYLTPVWLPPDPGHPDDTLWNAFELLGPLAQLQDDHPGSTLFWSKVSDNPFDSGAIVAAFLPEFPDSSIRLEFVDEPLFRLQFVVDTAKPFDASAEFWFQEANEHFLIDSAAQEYFCADCRRTNLAVDSGIYAQVSFPTLVVGSMMPHAGYMIVDHVDGIVIDGSRSVVPLGHPITYHIRTVNVSYHCILGTVNGFRVYGPDSFAPLQYDLPPLINEGCPSMCDCGFYDLVCGVTVHGVDGLGADTVGFHGSEMMMCGFSIGFDDIMLTITTQVDDSADIGGQICIDSCFFPPSGAWSWVPPEPSGPPYWNGPICHEIVHSCCIGDMRGNIDMDPADEINIADLVYLVTYMFDIHVPGRSRATLHVRSRYRRQR